MKSRSALIIVLFMLIPLISCKHKGNTPEIKIIYLHHSTGGVIWNGNTGSKTEKVSLPLLFKNYNKANGTTYHIEEIEFPKNEPYGWSNYPYDYYNIWVKNAGNEPFMEEPTLEILTREYQIIILKHCFPVSNLQADQDSADINSELKTLSNYKMQYLALRDKFHEFPATKFILFTGAAQVKNNITAEEAERAREFFSWVVDSWDLSGDNIYIWDLFSLQTEGGLYFKDEYAASLNDSHPNKEFAGKAVKLLFQRIIDVIQNDGIRTSLTGEAK